MQVTTRAFVFSSIKYSDADLIVSCFTERYGLKSYHLRGVLKSKKGKLRGSLFQPLTFLQLEAYHKDKGTLERIQEAKVIHPYKSLHTHVVKSSLVMFLTEILKNSVQEEETNLALFQFIENAFLWLDENEKIANFHLIFLLNLTSHLGFYPDFSEQEKPYFNVSEGVFQDSSEGAICKTGVEVEVVKKLNELDFDEAAALKINKKERTDTLALLLEYFRWHVQGYRTPKSLPVFIALFD